MEDSNYLVIEIMWLKIPLGIKMQDFLLFWMGMEEQISQSIARKIYQMYIEIN